MQRSLRFYQKKRETDLQVRLSFMKSNLVYDYFTSSITSSG